MNNEVKKQLTLSLILLALLIATLFFWYPNFMFHTYVERLDYQYCLRGENDEFVVDGYQFYQDGQTQGYGHARITPLKSQVFKATYLKIVVVVAITIIDFSFRENL